MGDLIGVILKGMFYKVPMKCATFEMAHDQISLEVNQHEIVVVIDQ
jgi:hypothetical protein